MMLEAQAYSDVGPLTEDVLRETLARGLAGRFRGQRVLVVVPDRTRTFPLARLFPLLVEALAGARQIECMVALGTHPPLDAAALTEWFGLSPGDSSSIAGGTIRFSQHAWDDPAVLRTLGIFPREQVQAFAGVLWHPSLGGDVPVRIHRAALECDHVLLVGPTFPHEIAGFSGGAKYLFPGISGPELIHITHWLGALATSLHTIGIEQTPVRAMIHAAADLLPTPVTLAACVVRDGDVAGLFIGPHRAAHHTSVEHSAQHHITWLDRPFQRVLSCAPPMYDELWTGAKAMYKLEPGIAEGGEVIIYAPHLAAVSAVHGAFLHRVGYHVRDYFLSQWERFADVPLGVLAHSTHLKGAGTFEDGIEVPRIRVTLASRIPRETCAALNLGYQDPASIRPEEWCQREDEGIGLVPKAGEQLLRLRAAPTP